MDFANAAKRRIFKAIYMSNGKKYLDFKLILQDTLILFTVRNNFQVLFPISN